MRLSLAYSPCPNDTFIFHAMINHLVDTEGFEFEVTLADVESLNRSAAEGKFDICKLSYHALFQLNGTYRALRSGSALGYNNAPILVKSEENALLTADSISSETLVAIPGEWTTAALLLKIAFPQVKRTKTMLFSEIEDAVLSKEVECGVLIHEGRFVYRDKGLVLIRDLGEFWHENFSTPIPLGVIATRRDLEESEKIERIIRKSIEFAMKNPEASRDYVSSNAQELSLQVQRSHIDLFVNKYTLDIGEEGEKAINVLYKEFKKRQ